MFRLLLKNDIYGSLKKHGKYSWTSWGLEKGGGLDSFCLTLVIWVAYIQRQKKTLVRRQKVLSETMMSGAACLHGLAMGRLW